MRCAEDTAFDSDVADLCVLSFSSTPFPATSVSSHVPRGRRFIVRDFTYDEEAIEKQKQDLVQLEKEEKELWVRRAPASWCCHKPYVIANPRPRPGSSPRRPTSCASRASTSLNSFRFSCTSRSSGRSLRVCCAMDCQRPTLPPSSRCVGLSPLARAGCADRSLFAAFPFPRLPLRPHHCTLRSPPPSPRALPIATQPDPKSVTKLTTTLSSHFGTGSKSSKIKGKKSGGDTEDAAVAGEFATVLEGEYLDFVLFEVERVEEGQ